MKVGSLKPTMSETDRLLSCLHWLSKPWAPMTSEWSERGNAVHQFLLDVASFGHSQALSGVPLEYLDLCAAIEISELPSCEPDKWASEVAFAYDWQRDSAYELGRGVFRDYSAASAFEFCGTADLVGLNDDEVIILDYKTGWRTSGSPKKLGQLRSYALAAARAYGRKRARVGTINPLTLRHQMELLTEDEVDAHAMALFGAFDSAVYPNTTRTFGPNQGPWCQYCPAFDQCDGKVTLVRAAAGEHDITGELTDAVLIAAITKVEALEGVVKRAWEIIEQRAKGNPILGPDGQVWGPQTKYTEAIDPGAYVALRDKYGAKFAQDAASVTIGKGTLTRALREMGKGIPGFKLGEAEKECLRGLRAAGLVEKKPRISFGWHTPETKALEAGDGESRRGEGVRAEPGVQADPGRVEGAGGGTMFVL